MIEHVIALVLSLQGHAAVIEKAGDFPTEEACHAYARLTRPQLAKAGRSIGCIEAGRLDQALQQLFGRTAAEIWK
jgi:hypothetical protein